MKTSKKKLENFFEDKPEKLKEKSKPQFKKILKI
jgi:hypothetical protein